MQDHREVEEISFFMDITFSYILHHQPAQWEQGEISYEQN